MLRLCKSCYPHIYHSFISGAELRNGDGINHRFFEKCVDEMAGEFKCRLADGHTPVQQESVK